MNVGFLRSGMARPLFYPSNDSYVLSSTGEPQAGVQVKIYTRQTGGTQITDLLYVNPDGTTGAAVTSGVLTSDGYGLIPAFAGPDGGATTVWGNHGMQGERIALTADPTGATSGGSGAYAPAKGAIRTPQRAGNLTVAIGDSQTSSSGTLTGQSEGWWSALIMKSNGRIRYGGTYATGGYTLEQIESTHLPTVLAKDPIPTHCIVAGGTNNVGANSGGGVGSGFNFTTSKATLTRICDALVARGITPVVVLVTPRPSTDTVGLANISTWNQWVTLFAMTYGYRVLDMYRPLVDPTSGSQKAALTSDGLHPNAAGYHAIADYAISQGLHLAWPPRSDFPGLFSGDSKNLILSGQGLNLADADSNGYGDGWAVTGTNLSGALVAPQTSDNLLGNWQQITRASGATGQAWIARSFAGWSIGDTLRISARIQTSGVVAAGGSWSVYVKNDASTTLVGLGPNAWTRDVADGFLLQDFVVPSDFTSTSRFYALLGSATGSASVLRIGEVSVQNLTTMGVATL